MSFYFDDELQSQQVGEEGFVCANCGGTSSYPDANTGALCCDSCFTQSQVLPDTELELEQVQALAARTNFGRVIGTTVRRNKGATATTTTRRKPLEEFNTSTPFPSLIICIHGMQQVMKHCIEILSGLVGVDSLHQVDTTVQSLWMSYLRAWTDGAEYYGKLHPEIRFSFRDYFLPPDHKTKIIKHLSHRAACAIRKEEEKKDSSEEGMSSARTRVAHEPHEERDDEKVRPDSNLTKGHQRTIAHFRKSYHRPTHLMWVYWDKGKRGRLEAALMTAPSMRLVACLLWLGVSRAGVTLHHMLMWISNGALPLQNAFRHCLSEQEQAALANVSSFFRMTKLPTMKEMENLVCKLVVACGLKSFSHLHGMPVSKANPNNAVRVISERRKEARRRPDFSYVTPQTVPLLTERLIDDFGFDKQILARSFALMGILKEDPTKMWLPAPLQGARPENLWSTAHVLAVIVVACKMTPGWETWVYPLPTGQHKDPIKVEENILDCQEQERVTKRRRTETAKNRFVPYNADNFRLLTNGPVMEGYLDYLEDTVLDEKEAIFPNFRSQLTTTIGDEVSPTTEANEVVVRRRPVLKESRDPFGRKRIWKRQKFHDWYFRLGKKQARWADANGLGEYVIYTEPKTTGDGRAKPTPLPEPFHPQYGLLIEYLSHKTNVKPSKIHAVVAVLDKEVMCSVRPQVSKRV